MDEIQKVLMKAGRKDLAQKYYEKVASCGKTHSKKKDEELMFDKESQGGYLELMEMDPNWKIFEKGMKALDQIWKRWKNGPMTEPSDIRPAKKDLLDYVKDMLKGIK